MSPNFVYPHARLYWGERIVGTDDQGARGRIRNKVAVFLSEALRLRMLRVLGEEPSGGDALRLIQIPYNQGTHAVARFPVTR